MSEEGYKPTEEEVRKAEEVMTDEQKEITEVISDKANEIIEKFSGRLGADTCRQIIESYSFDNKNETTTFNARGHEVVFYHGSPFTIKIDGEVLDYSNAIHLAEKYNPILSELSRFDSGAVYRELESRQRSKGYDELMA